MIRRPLPQSLHRLATNAAVLGMLAWAAWLWSR
jgi:hypothetical protein